MCCGGVREQTTAYLRHFWEDTPAARSPARWLCGAHAWRLLALARETCQLDRCARWLAALAELPGAAYVGVVRPADWYAGVLDGLLDVPAQTRCVHDHYGLRHEHYVRIDQPEHEH